MTPRALRRGAGAFLWVASALWMACDAGPAAKTRPPQDGSARDRSAAPIVRVSVGMHVVRAELADTPARRQRGLSGRPSLSEGEGMLFPYAEPGLYAFWMPDMHFDIDIVWIRGSRVVDITHRALHDPPGELPRYRPKEPADLVLEVPAGTAARLGWREGDPVVVAPPIRATASPAP